MSGPRASVTQVIALALLLGALGAVWVSLTRGEAAFCQSVFTKLAQGKGSVRTQIAWERLQALGMDVGTTYLQLATEQERRNYQDAFITQYAQAFRAAGGAPKAFTGWRIQEQREGQVIVAADYSAKQKTLLMSVPASGPKRVEAIQWQ